MESLLVSIISVALVVVATVTMTMNLFSSTVSITDSWKKLEAHVESVQRTAIQVIPPASYNGGEIELMVANTGQTSLSDFAHWDLIADYQSGHTSYLSYTTDPAPGDNEWTLTGIFLTTNSTKPEVFDINILNNMESARIVLNLMPVVGNGESVRFTVSTDNGVTSQCIVTNS